MTIQDIPKFYTALAEWLSCLVFIVLLRPRFPSGMRTVFLVLGAAVLSILQFLIGIVPLWLWMPGMVIALAVMYGLILLCCQLRGWEALFFWSTAFLFAEFTASLEWQLYSFFFHLGLDGFWLRLVFLAVVYGVCFGCFFMLERKRLWKQMGLPLSPNEAEAAALIAIGAFLISNISYVDTNNPLSGHMSPEIFYIRTLVDFAGVIMLFAQHDRIRDAQVKRELSCIESLFQRQYEQYRQSQESIALIHQKYHDLKHQIAIIRMEPDLEKREEYLRKMESGMQYYEAEVKTGNQILDTILTSKKIYCLQHGISLNIVADGEKLKFVNTMDLCSIFGNALDNAIESVEKNQDNIKKLIKIAVYAQNNFLMIRIGNYYEQPPQIDDGEYRTTKNDRDYHGFGIKSIRYTAESYGGSVSIDTSDNWFTLKVLLPIPTPSSQ